MAYPWSVGDQLNAADLNAVAVPPGAILPYGGKIAPTSGNWLICDGTAQSRSTYATLFGILFPSLGTVTITIASPGVVSLTSHGLATGDAIYLTTTGALPTGFGSQPPWRMHLPARRSTPLGRRVARIPRSSHPSALVMVRQPSTCPTCKEKSRWERINPIASLPDWVKRAAKRLTY